MADRNLLVGRALAYRVSRQISREFLFGRVDNYSFSPGDKMGFTPVLIRGKRGNGVGKEAGGGRRPGVARRANRVYYLSLEGGIEFFAIKMEILRRRDENPQTPGPNPEPTRQKFGLPGRFMDGPC